MQKMPTQKSDENGTNSVKENLFPIHKLNHLYF